MTITEMLSKALLRPLPISSLKVRTNVLSLAALLLLAHVLNLVTEILALWPRGVYTV